MIRNSQYSSDVPPHNSLAADGFGPHHSPPFRPLPALQIAGAWSPSPTRKPILPDLLAGLDRRIILPDLEQAVCLTITEGLTFPAPPLVTRIGKSPAEVSLIQRAFNALPYWLKEFPHGSDPPQQRFVESNAKHQPAE